MPLNLIVPAHQRRISCVVWLEFLRTMRAKTCKIFENNQNRTTNIIWIPSNSFPSTTFPRRTCEANDYAEHSVSARDQSLHSELNQSDGTISYPIESTTVPKFWQAAFSSCPKSQKCQCHFIEVGKAVSRTSTRSTFLICKWTCQTSLLQKKVMTKIYLTISVQVNLLPQVILICRSSTFPFFHSLQEQFPTKKWKRQRKRSWTRLEK